MLDGAIYRAQAESKSEWQHILLTWFPEYLCLLLRSTAQEEIPSIIATDNAPGHPRALWWWCSEIVLLHMLVNICSAAVDREVILTFSFKYTS